MFFSFHKKCLEQLRGGHRETQRQIFGGKKDLEGRRNREMQERCRIEMVQRSRESEIQTAKMAGDKWQK